jgi:hypothetical protein
MVIQTERSTEFYNIFIFAHSFLLFLTLKTNEFIALGYAIKIFKRVWFIYYAFKMVNLNTSNININDYGLYQSLCNINKVLIIIHFQNKAWKRHFVITIFSIISHFYNFCTCNMVWIPYIQKYFTSVANLI